MSDEQLAQAPVPEQPVEAPQQPAEEEEVTSLSQLLEKNDGPTEAQVEELKQKFGEVFISAFSETELYVWRPLMRDEFRTLQLMLNNPDAPMDQLQYEEKICETCVLWPSKTAAEFASAKGGTATSLAEQIMQNSNFFNPQQVSMLVQKL
jgi:hypothetical protein